MYVGTFDTLMKAAVAADYKRTELGLAKEKMNFPGKHEVIQKAIEDESKGISDVTQMYTAPGRSQSTFQKQKFILNLRIKSVLKVVFPNEK